jgi:hypothetical protein
MCDLKTQISYYYVLKGKRSKAGAGDLLKYCQREGQSSKAVAGDLLKYCRRD